MREMIALFIAHMLVLYEYSKYYIYGFLFMAAVVFTAYTGSNYYYDYITWRALNE